MRGVLTRAAARLLKATIRHFIITAAGSIFGPEVGLEQLAEEIVDAGLAAYEIAREIAPYVKPYFDPPKTLDELRQAAGTRRIGYDVHHIVEQATLAADGTEDDFIDSPDNLVSISTAKHWDLNGWHQKENRNYGGLTPRQYVKDKSLAERYKVGLEGLREIKMLKP